MIVEFRLNIFENTFQNNVKFSIEECLFSIFTCLFYYNKNYNQTKTADRKLQFSIELLGSVKSKKNKLNLG